MEPVFISVGVMVGALLLIAYYVQNGVGGMSQPLQTLGRFLLVKAPAGAVDSLTTALAAVVARGPVSALRGWFSRGPSVSWAAGTTGTPPRSTLWPASVGPTTTAAGWRRRSA